MSNLFVLSTNIYLALIYTDVIVPDRDISKHECVTSTQYGI